MKIKTKLPLLVVGTAMTTALALGYFYYQRSAADLRLAAQNSLTALRISRQSSLRHYLNSINETVEVLAASTGVRDAVYDLDAAFQQIDADKAGKTEVLQRYYDADHIAGGGVPLAEIATDGVRHYKKIHDHYHPWFEEARKQHGFYDVFIFNRAGDLVYTVVKERDYATNLLHGDWRDTQLARSLRGALQIPPVRDEMFSDYKNYEPSFGAPASFLAKPIRVADQAAGVLAVQIPSNRISDIMRVTAGMGETGETYIVGPDFLMRSDSRFSEESTILRRKIEIEPVVLALAGQNGTAEFDTPSGRTLVSYAPFDFHGTRWAIIANKALSEVNRPIIQLRNRMLMIGGVVALLFASLGYLFARNITRPLGELSGAFQRFQNHRQAEELPLSNRVDEIGSIARGFGELSREIETYVHSVKTEQEKSDELAAKMRDFSNKLSRYLSPQIHESIFSGEKDVEISTDRKKLTVFFSDIVNFTATTENMQPEDLAYLLNHYLTEMTDIALAHGATIDKFIGDAMLLFFGDPVSRGVKEDAIACLRMAVAMQDRMHVLRRELEQKGYATPFHMRIGINTGYCNVGNFGSDQRIDYTIIGGEVNLASRLESLAPPDGIMMSYETYALVQDIAEAEEGDAIDVKGISYPVTPYRLIGLRDAKRDAASRMAVDTDGFRLDLDLDRLKGAGLRKARSELNKAIAKLDNRPARRRKQAS